MAEPARPRSRGDAVALAVRCVAAAEAEAARRGALVLDGSSRPLHLVTALRETLIQRVADVLERPGAVLAPPPGWRARAERWLYRAREAGQALEQRLRQRSLEGPSAGERRVLAVARMDGQLRDVIPVARAARARGWGAALLAFNPAEAERARSAEIPAVLHRALARPDVARALRLRLELGRADGALGVPPPGLDAAGWERASAAIVSECRTHVHEARITANAVARALDRFAPQVVLVGNPCVPFGTITIELARARGIPTVAIQHGEIGRGDGAWARCGVSRLAVWGDRPRAVLESIGVPPEALVATGAPWVDVLRRTAGAARRGDRARTVLVALSGAGHAMGMEEHLDHVRRVCAAARELPEVAWRVRLHPKDDAAIYERMLREVPGGQVRVEDPRRTGVDIHTQLAEADVLITVQSAAALDAMLHDVPVVTLGRPEREPLAPAAEAGATTHAPLGAALATVVSAVLDRGAGPEVRARAARYVGEFFGPMDGRAADRIADLLEATAAGPRR